jgi:ribosomal-protein-alanine N-acetyltransferase
MLESKRLLHKKFTTDDLDRLIEMRIDVDVRKYLGGEKMQNPEALKHRLEFYISCYEKNIGMHAIIWKETDEMIGWSGLQPLEGTDEIEVSYGMIKEFWGRGIGFEAALFWLEYGFKEIELERIVAVADKENVGSWRIMEKLGMKYQKSEIHYGMECVVYEISRDEYLSNLV